jgi:hypothetical protein
MQDVNSDYYDLYFEGIFGENDTIYLDRGSY